MKTVNFNVKCVNGDYKNVIGYKWSPFDGIDLVVHKGTFSDNYWDVSEPVSGCTLTNIIRSTTMKRTKELAIKFIEKKGVQTTIDVIKRTKKSLEPPSDKEILKRRKAIETFKGCFNKAVSTDFLCKTSSITNEITLDVIKFDDFMVKSYGYDIDKDGSLKQFITKTFGKHVSDAINVLL